MTATARRRGWCALLVLLWIGACTDHDPLFPEMEAARGGPTVGAPSNLTATAADFHQVWLAWRDNANNDDGVEVYRSDTGPTGSFFLFTTYPWPNVTAGGNDGLTGGNQYCFKVRYYRGTRPVQTVYSAFSNIACVTTPLPPGPIAPSNLIAVPRADYIEVRWVDHSSDEEGFRVERADASTGPWSVLRFVSPNEVTFYDFAPLPLEQRACYRAVAYTHYSGYFSEAASNVMCTARPAAPSALIATVTGSDVDLRWTDNSAVEDGFEIYRWSASGAFARIGTVGANVTAYHDAGLADDVYSYEVFAAKDGATSNASNSASATILTGPPVAPTVDAVPAASTVVGVSWTYLNTATGYRVQRSTDGGGTWVDAFENPSTGFNDQDQPSEQQLCYRVFASNQFGVSPASNPDCTFLPLGPTGLAGVAGDGPVIDLAWTDNSAVEDGYEVDRLVYYCDWYDCYYQWDVIAYLGPNETSFRDVNVWSGDTFTYKVRALRDGGGSDESNEIVLVTP